MSVCESVNYQNLFRQHAPALRNYLYYRCGNETQAADWVQEAFLRLWKNCAKVSYGKAKSWLYTVSKNLHFNEIEHQKVVMKFQQQHTDRDESPHDPQTILEGKETLTKVQQAIQALPVKQRTVLLMNRMDGLTYKEIAAVEGVSVKAIEKRMHKALVALRAVY